MAADFRAAVERLTGRNVRAFIGGNHSTPDVAAELFILDGPARKPGCGRVGLIRGRSVAL